VSALVGVRAERAEAAISHALCVPCLAGKRHTKEPARYRYTLRCKNGHQHDGLCCEGHAAMGRQDGGGTCRVCAAPFSITAMATLVASP
jgi:hypothetical protein